MMKRDEGTTSSGNVFEDLGLPNPEDHLIKAELALQIKRFVKAKGWTQAQAAEVIGIGQPKLSQIFCGEFAGISVERLMRILTRLGHSVEVRISADEYEAEEANLTVRVA